MLRPTRLHLLKKPKQLICAAFVHAEPNRQEQKCCAFEEEYKKFHIPTNTFQKALLSIGSAAVSILNPHRGDMIACMGETTGLEAIKYMKTNMENCEEGQRILTERPRINSTTVDLVQLSKMPEGTLGKTYSNFLEFNNVTPDAREAVHFVDDVNLAYVMLRYREIHDLIHTVLGMPTNMLGEVTVKWVEAIQTHLPMCISGALFGPLRLKTKHRQLYEAHYLPWAIKTGYNMKLMMNIYYEERWEQSLEEFHKEINFHPLILPEKNATKQQSVN